MQHNKYVKNQDARMYCTTNHFREKNLGPQNKPHGVRGLGKNCHTHFNAKLGHVTY